MFICIFFSELKMSWQMTYSCFISKSAKILPQFAGIRHFLISFVYEYFHIVSLPVWFDETTVEKEFIVLLIVRYKVNLKSGYEEHQSYRNIIRSS